MAAYDRRQAPNPALDSAVALLRGWNGQMDKDQAAPFLIGLAYRTCARAVADNAAPGNGPQYEFPLAPPGRGETAARTSRGLVSGLR